MGFSNSGACISLHKRSSQSYFAVGHNSLHFLPSSGEQHAICNRNYITLAERQGEKNRQGESKFASYERQTPAVWEYSVPAIMH